MRSKTLGKQVEGPGGVPWRADEVLFLDGGASCWGAFGL